MSYQYFFSSLDTDFKPTGSRDPLGLQVIWQEAGSQVIPFLSTVSSSLRDFKIMCLAHAYFGEGIDRSTFIRLEQLCAYVRYYYYRDEGFNGIEKVRKRFSEDSTYPITISANKTHALLASQITYGIWGKYNRPFNAMELREKYVLPDLSADEKHILNTCKKDTFELTEEMIKTCHFIHLNTVDKSFFTQNLLKLPLIAENRQACKHQNELFEIISRNEALIKEKDFFSLINKMQQEASDDLKKALETIKQTEKVITPLNRIFKHIQTKNIWTSNQQDDVLDTYIEQLTPIDYPFKNESTIELQNILNIKDTWKIIEGLTAVNAKVSNNRNKSPWISREKEDFVLNEKNGAIRIDYWEKRPNNDFYYFLNTYINLYNQIEAI